MKDFLIDNVKKIEEKILEGNYPNITKDFVDMLKVDKRTVKRYIKFMKENLYLPVEYDSHKKGFFYTNTKRTLKNFFEENPDYSITNSDECSGKQRRDELLNILISNVTSKGLACPSVDDETKAHIQSTERNLNSCNTVEEILLYYDFSLRAKTGNEVASVLRNNGLLCFESPEVAELVNKYRK